MATPFRILLAIGLTAVMMVAALLGWFVGRTGLWEIILIAVGFAILFYLILTRHFRKPPPPV